MLVYDRVLIGKVMLNLTVGTATAMPHANMFLFLFLLINFNFLVTFLVTFIWGRGGGGNAPNDAPKILKY